MDKERFAQRQLQIELAEKKGYSHMGTNAKQSRDNMAKKFADIISNSPKAFLTFFLFFV